MSPANTRLFETAQFLIESLRDPLILRAMIGLGTADEHRAAMRNIEHDARLEGWTRADIDNAFRALATN